MFHFLFSRVAVVSKSFQGKTDSVEKWYGTEYSIRSIEPDVIKVNYSSRQSDLFTLTMIMLLILIRCIINLLKDKYWSWQVELLILSSLIIYLDKVNN